MVINVDQGATLKEYAWPVGNDAFAYASRARILKDSYLKISSFKTQEVGIELNLASQAESFRKLLKINLS